MLELLTNSDYSINAIVVELVVVFIATLFGRYVVPKVPKDTIDEASKSFKLIVDYAEKYVAWAKEFMQTKTGEEKMKKVCELLKNVADMNNIAISNTTIEAIVQKAYDSMKAAEPHYLEECVGTIKATNTTFAEDETNKEENAG